MQTLSKESIIQLNCIPVLKSLAVVALGAFIAMTFFDKEKIQLLYVVFFFAGMTIGWTTPKDAVDHRGTNGVVLLALAWGFYALFFTWLFPIEYTLSDWFFTVMGSNIINGFTIIMGAFVGTYCEKRYAASGFVFPKDREAFEKYLTQLKTLFHEMKQEWNELKREWEEKEKK